MFTKRLQEMLTYYELSASAFAEKMGVGRSSISHIISGRNKPSLDFVLHILENFKEVTFDWLILGKGNFPKINISENTPPTLFSSEENTLKNKRLNSDSEDLFSNMPTNAPTNSAKTEVTEKLSIDRIVIFYSNHTFKEYKNN